MRTLDRPERALSLVEMRRAGQIPPSDLALALDARLRGLVRATELLDRVLGRGLDRLIRRNGLARLGYASLSDYVTQRLGLKPRLAQELAWIERSLPAYPVTARLYDQGRLTYAKVRALLRAYAKPGVWPLPGMGERPEEAGVSGGTRRPVAMEEAWARTALTLTVRRLEDALHDWRSSKSGFGVAGEVPGKEVQGPAVGDSADEGRGAAEGEEPEGPASPETAPGMPPSPGLAAEKVAEQAYSQVSGQATGERLDAEGYPLHPPDLSDTADLCQDERPKGRQVRFSATPLQAAKWYVALEMASRQAGRDLSPSAMLEGAFAEFLVGEGYDVLLQAGWEPGASGSANDSGCEEAGAEGAEEVGPGSDGPGLRGSLGSRDSVTPEISSHLEQGHALGPEAPPESQHKFADEFDPGPDAKSGDDPEGGVEGDDHAFWHQVERDISDLNDHWAHLSWNVPAAETPQDLECTGLDDPFEMDRRLVATVRIKQESQASLVRLLGQMVGWGLFRELEFVRLDQYARERLGMSASSARSLVGLHQRLASCPKTRAAFRSGRIHLTQAHEIVRIAREHTEEAWLERASRTTVRFLREDVDEALRRVDLVSPEEAGFPPHRCNLREERDSQERGGTSCQTCARWFERGVPNQQDEQASPGFTQSPFQTCAQPGLEMESGNSTRLEQHSVNHPDEVSIRDEGNDSALRRLADAIDAPGRRGSEFRRLLHGVLKDLQTKHTLHGNPRIAGLESAEADTNLAGGATSSDSNKTPKESSFTLPEALFPPRKSKAEAESASELLTLGFWLPAELSPLFEEVTAAVSLLHGTVPSVATVIDEVLDAYLAQWGLEAVEAIRSHPALDRAGWRCAVPVCTSRANLHSHHIHYRSRGGGNTLSNLVPLCASHHLYGEHTGYLHVTGLAPHNLEWKLGLRSRHQSGHGAKDAPDKRGELAPHLTVRGRCVVAPTPEVSSAAKVA